MDTVLQTVRDFADTAHGQQQRKYSADRYIVHPVRVMALCQQYTSRRPVLAAALLHDVLEDTPVTKEQLLRFLRTVMSEDDATETVRLTIELTDVYTKKMHPRWNRKTRKRKEAERIQRTSADSQTVKYADIIDNCREIVDHDPDFAQVFLCECKNLLRVIPNGEKELYDTAVNTVNSCLQRVRAG